MPVAGFDLQPDGCFIDFSKELFANFFYRAFSKQI
jgi:hypothetical protein